MGTKLEPLRRRKKKPSFCKVMVGDFSTRLRIPEAFVKYFDGGVPYKSVLWGPSGISWRVNVKEVDNNLFFHKGWGAFVQDNSLKMADFLLFRYAGDSNFCVKIYGKDCCEKGVSGDSTKSCTPVCGNENEEVKIMRNHLKRTREKLVGSGANEVGTKRSVIIHIDSDASDDDIGKSLEVFPRHLSFKSLKIQKSARALEAANKFISNYPSFQVLMYHAYVHAGNLVSPLT
ncbi:B3 domain-containing protein Os01g0723500-like [Fagus crenata]